MTGLTHDQMAVTGALVASAAGTVVGVAGPVDTLAMCAGAYGLARAPDYTERGPFGLWKFKHRHETHLAVTGLLVGLVVWIVGAMMTDPSMHGGVAAFALGCSIGWWMHSLADMLTDKGCWFTRCRRQVLLPDQIVVRVLRWSKTIHPRIKVFTIEKRRNRWTGKTKTVRRPSTGERVYFRAAQATNGLLVAAHVALVATLVQSPA